MDAKVCAIFNYAPHYRESIYLLMEKELNAYFYFGDMLKTNIKKADYSIFKNKVVEVNNIFLPGPLYYQKGVLRLLFKKYDKYIITGETYSISTFIFLLLAKVIGKDVYLWGHGCRGNEAAINMFIKKISSYLYTGFFLYGNYAKELLIEKGFNKDKLHIIYNSLDYDAQLSYRKKMKSSNIYHEHFGNDNKTIYFIGRLNLSKKLDMLIDALALLIERGKHYNLVLIGGGDSAEFLKEYALQKGIDNIWFYGECYDEGSLSNLIYNADLCVSPGNVGLTAIHSLVYGTPVITHNNFMKQGPEFEAIVDNKTGLFFIHNDVLSLAEKIEEWFDIMKDSSREEISNRCYEVIDQKYNPHRQIEILKRGMKI